MKENISQANKSTEAAIADTTVNDQLTVAQDKPKQNSLQQENAPTRPSTEATPVEHGGPKGLEPTRYGDWEQKGRCTDF